ncbi:MAG: uracil-DNA glycosylase [Acidobacteriota bacterium]|nr:MAG: uracil-DNA glycosylase [Acidobacteriota bacterium]
MADNMTNLRAQLIGCRACSRLVEHREEVARERRRAYRDQCYWGRPVPGFGPVRARLVVVGLAPGAHGSNRTGRMFTGDASGDFLYRTMHEFGFASQSRAVSRSDGLRLIDAFVTAVARCVPPANKPTPEELQRCGPFLRRELLLLRAARVYVALGQIAFIRLCAGLSDIGRAPVSTRPRFMHGAEFTLDGGEHWLLASYHPSRQNTQTGRLTREMFGSVFRRARALIDGRSATLSRVKADS